MPAVPPIQSPDLAQRAVSFTRDQDTLDDAIGLLNDRVIGVLVRNIVHVVFEGEGKGGSNIEFGRHLDAAEAELVCELVADQETET